MASSPELTALDVIRQAGVIVASDGAEYHKIGEFQPIDATTNPSLVYAAVSKTEYSHLVDEAVRHAQVRLTSSSIDEKVTFALDYLLVLVGAQILSIIPGRVSISVDPRLGFSYSAILSKSRALIKHVDDLHISRSRILIKIPATAAGIHAAHTLETVDGIHTNMTLVFSLVQALACAQAGVAVVSPFIGRVKDWWAAKAIAEGNPSGLTDQPLPEHPGIKLVHRIRDSYAKYGYKTQIMAAGFRKVEEIIELGRAGSEYGADFMTLPPDLLDGLRTRSGVIFPNPRRRSTSIPDSPVLYFSSDGPTEEGLAAFERDSKMEAISLDKVPEGLDKFSIDTIKLEEKVRALVEREVNLSEITKTGGFVKRGAGVARDVGLASGEVCRRRVPVN